MSWEYNLYYSPEKMGLKVVGMVEDEPDYSFNMFVVWEDEAGLLYVGSDSGCSCPSPFEDVGSVEELERIGSYDQFVRAFDSWRGTKTYPAADSLRRKVRRRLAKT